MKILHHVKGMWVKRAEMEPPLISVRGDIITMVARGGKYEDIQYRVVITKHELDKINTAYSKAQERN